MSTTSAEQPRVLRDYAFVADGERGALVGPRGDIAFGCAPGWDDDAVFSGLLGGAGTYVVRPADDRFVRGGHYERDTLVWRSRWVTQDAEIECREAFAFPGDPGRAVLLRRVEPPAGEAHLVVRLDVRAGFGTRPMQVRRTADGVWEGTSGDVAFRWTGAPASTTLRDGVLVAGLTVPAGGRHDLVLELSRSALPTRRPDPDALWRTTENAWCDGVPDLASSASPGESRHAHAVLRGLTTAHGAMVAAATTALPERAEQGRNYDYRYAWIRDQCYAGQAAAAVGDHALLDRLTGFVTARVLEDGPDLAPAYRTTGGRLPPERDLPLPGYPGAPVRVGNRVTGQFQLDVLGEALLLLSAARRAGRLDGDGREAVTTLVDAVRRRAGQPDAGIWELDDRRWAHSRLMCVAGLRAVADDVPGATAMADDLLAGVDADCLHPRGRWQRSPDDPAVDAALLLPGIRGAVPAHDPRNVATVAAVVDDLADDGYVYRFRQDPDRPLHDAEGAFLLCGFLMSLARLGTGHREEAVRWFERTRAALGSPGLFTEEYDVVERQLRGNLPQAFVHALLLETAHRLAAAGVPHHGFTARAR